MTGPRAVAECQGLSSYGHSRGREYSRQCQHRSLPDVLLGNRQCCVLQGPNSYSFADPAGSSGTGPREPDVKRWALVRLKLSVFER